MSETIKGALFSPDRVYRYVLTRRWDEGRRQLVVIGLNPSTADETVDDPTIRRCIRFAKDQRCSALVMLNLFALRATDPRAIKSHSDPVGPGNDETLRTYCWGDDVIVVAAWGVHGAYMGRSGDVLRLGLPHLNCWGKTKHGQPRHPLYLRADTPMESLL
ncbi:MAG TPA: DUF1643 domain-containing protein [Gemmatimonadaceae bacterium]|nr:DUF1643 domain-containing protein [Gemmatimonadaceae bacterium]